MDDVKTCRDLILYILENKLEDKSINEIYCLKNFITVKRAAVKYNVGEETIKTWFALGILGGIQIGNTLYISPIKNDAVAQLKTPTAEQTYDAFMMRNSKR